MLGLLLVSVLSGAALARVVSASTQGRYQGSCVPTAIINGTSSTLSNRTAITNGIWVTTTSLNGTEHHYCLQPVPMVYGSGKGIVVTTNVAPNGYLAIVNGNSITIRPLPAGTSSPSSTTSTVSQNTTQATSSTH